MLARPRKGAIRDTHMTSQVQEGTILLGKYRVEKELGRGAMGYVVAARHEHLGELFAIKLMLPEVLEIPGTAERFLREARACARIKSEHVVRVTDSGEHDGGVPFMVMEYLTGEDLQSLLDNRRFFPMHEAISYVLQACDAIAEAHSQGIIHRDLKPSNLFLAQRPNGKPCVKVLDFGISKDLENRADAASKLTATGSVVGTPSYMSPEQMQAHPTDNRSDIWSLGVILYEFVTGQLPFPGQSYATIAGKVLYEEPMAPRRLRGGMPAEFDAVVLRCLQKAPEKRFQSVRELMEALQPLMSMTVTPDVSIVAALDDSPSIETKATLLDEDKATVQQSAPDVPSKFAKSTEALPTEAGKSEGADATNPAPNFYAKRVFSPPTKSARKSPLRARAIGTIAAFLFAASTIGLAIALWVNQDRVKRYISKEMASPSASVAESARAPSMAASTAPSASASTSTTTRPKPAPKPAPKSTK